MPGSFNPINPIDIFKSIKAFLMLWWDNRKSRVLELQIQLSAAESRIATLTRSVSELQGKLVAAGDELTHSRLREQELLDNLIKDAREVQDWLAMHVSSLPIHGTRPPAQSAKVEEISRVLGERPRTGREQARIKTEEAIEQMKKNLPQSVMEQLSEFDIRNSNTGRM
jgi:hypothetical protein